MRLLDQALASQSFRESTARLALEALRDHEEDNWWRKAKTWLGKTQLQGDNDEEKLDLLTARIVGWLREELTRLRAEPRAPAAPAAGQLLTRLAERLRRRPSADRRPWPPVSANGCTAWTPRRWWPACCLACAAACNANGAPAIRNSTPIGQSD